MDRQEELRQWFSLAKQNLEVAKHLLATFHPAPVEIICNNCQQSAEKYLKGYLFINNIEPPKTHNLVDLLDMCANIQPDFSIFERKCDFLTNFGVMPRYPNELQIIEDDAKADIRFAEEIKEFVVNITHNSNKS
jgi:HEPN domain-containing protein